MAEREISNLGLHFCMLSLAKLVRNLLMVNVAGGECESISRDQPGCYIPRSPEFRCLTARACGVRLNDLVKLIPVTRPSLSHENFAG